MDCTVRIVKAEIHTLDVHVDAASKAEALAKVKLDLPIYKDMGNWQLQDTEYEYEFEEPRRSGQRAGA